MSKFDKYKIQALKPTQHRYLFPNGRGASVVWGQYAYGGDEGFFELAVLDTNLKLDYETEITSDVEGWLTEADVEALLQRIFDLPPKGA